MRTKTDSSRPLLDGDEVHSALQKGLLDYKERIELVVKDLVAQRVKCCGMSVESNAVKESYRSGFELLRECVAGFCGDKTKLAE